MEAFFDWITQQHLPWILISKKMTVTIWKSKYIEKKVIRHINENVSDFSSSHESDEEQLPG